ncbi:MAG: rod shape-determining protein MreD [Ruminococcaceae bacterium]|nr:rod shape-determining protein MreD [Oscillospiraceae bacterium]
MKMLATRMQPKSNSSLLLWVLMAVLIFLVTVLQTTVVQGLEIFHVVPNLLFIVVVCFGLLQGDYSALFVGMICGLLLDFAGSRIIGINTLLCTYVGYACAGISDNLYNRNAFVSMLFVFLFTIPYELLIYIFNFSIWGRGAFVFALFCKILPAAIYNFLFTVLLDPIVRKIVD